MSVRWDSNDYIQESHLSTGPPSLFPRSNLILRMSPSSARQAKPFCNDLKHRGMAACTEWAARTTSLSALTSPKTDHALAGFDQNR
jgi:hypothetical protein